MQCEQVIPILFSSDVIRSLDYYTEILGFENRWDWGNPPTFGGVGKDKAAIFFCEQGQGNPGTWISVLVDDVDQFYETIKAKGAKILSAPETMPWNVREMLVEDPDGHKIRFGQHVYIPAVKKDTFYPADLRIVQRVPTIHEFRKLSLTVGWSPSTDDTVVEKILTAPVFAVVAEDVSNDEVIGCVLLLGDNASFYYVKDVMVHPAWQHKMVGSALMHELKNWLDTIGANHALVGLYTGSTLAPFYEQFGFTPAFGMQRKIHRNEKNE
jgi:GNAT superfamily N-acetyltransferase/catechol 2,3-dioxygenase-like lactoylglutathione lyase family enzyme